MTPTSCSALLALATSLVTLPLRAQQDTASAGAPGYSVGVIAADSIARTALVTTFSELITARLAGVDVLSRSGTIDAASRILICGGGGGCPRGVLRRRRLGREGWRVRTPECGANETRDHGRVAPRGPEPEQPRPAEPAWQRPAAAVAARGAVGLDRLRVERPPAA